MASDKRTASWMLANLIDRSKFELIVLEKGKEFYPNDATAPA